MNQKKWLHAFISATILVAILVAGIFIYTADNRNTDTVTLTEVSATIAPTNAPSVVLPSPDIILPTSTPAPTPEPTPTPFQEYDIQLLAVGDNLLHMGIVNTGKQSDGSYNYDFLFDNITEYLDLAEIKIINQETILGGNHLGFSGYPTFNSPTEVGDAITKAGFNAVLHSSNHTTDKGMEGLLNCVDYWQNTHPEVLICGISDPEAETDIPLLTVDNYTFAILNYTYSPNSVVLKNEYMGYLDMLCNYDTETGAIDFTTLNPNVIEDIQLAKTLADIVIVCPHWGTEYQTTPSRYQKNFAIQMAEAGADLIIGTHPHVPQPVEWLECSDGRRTLCYYSLGNYVSTQKQAICMLEGMAWVSFHVTETDIYISEDNTGVLPLVCHYNSEPVRLENVYPLEEYTEEMALRHGIWQYGEVPIHLDELQAQSDTIFGEMVLSVADILQNSTN